MTSGSPEESPDRPPVLSRRALLQRSGLAAAGAGAAVFLAACSGGPAPSWTFPAAASAPTASPQGSPPATASPEPSPSAQPSTPTSSPAASSSTPPGSASPSASASPPREPSPADFATPPPYRAKQTSPIVFNLESFDGPGEAILIAPGKTYNSMNFEHQVPAPTLRVSEGDTVRFTLTNRGAIPHSIDFHAARTPWNTNYRTVAAGESITFDWQATAAGVFMYHCGAPPVLMHIGDGMYGTVIVDPPQPRTTAREYLLVISEWYGSGGDYQAMLNNPPDVVAWNGKAFRYRDAPLPVTAGETVRLFLMNAGPNSVCSFHVIGALIDHFEQDGNPGNASGLHQSVEVLPGGGALVELTIPEAGQYPFVTHRMNDMEKGAMGLFDVKAG